MVDQMQVTEKCNRRLLNYQQPKIAMLLTMVYLYLYWIVQQVVDFGAIFVAGFRKTAFFVQNRGILVLIAETKKYVNPPQLIRRRANTNLLPKIFGTSSRLDSEQCTNQKRQLLRENQNKLERQFQIYDLPLQNLMGFEPLKNIVSICRNFVCYMTFHDSRQPH